MQPNVILQKKTSSNQWRKVKKRFIFNELNRASGYLFCVYCEKEVFINPPDPNLKVSIDHFIPLSLGGEQYNFNNLRISCTPCNTQKSNMMFDDWKYRVANKGKVCLLKIQIRFLAMKKNYCQLLLSKRNLYLTLNKNWDEEEMKELTSLIQNIFHRRFEERNVCGVFNIYKTTGGYIISPHAKNIGRDQYPNFYLTRFGVFLMKRKRNWLPNVVNLISKKIKELTKPKRLVLKLANKTYSWI
jgi:hypothetical protein